MRLEMFAFTVDRSIAVPNTAFDLADVEGVSTLHRWNNHKHLHAWMGRLYYRTGGTAERFNRIALALNSLDLDVLEKAVLTRTLPEGTGPLFGLAESYEFDADLAFVAKASRAIAHGLGVFYYSRW